MFLLRKIFILLLIFNFKQIFAQEKIEDSPPIKDRFVFGGTLGAQFGTYTSVLVSPMVGFYFTPKLLGGTSILYQYYHEEWKGSGINTHIFGTSLFTEYDLVSNIGKKLPLNADFSIISHLEYEALNLDRDFSSTGYMKKMDRFWLHGILVGGGFKQKVGKRSSFNITFLYNLLWDDRAPYTNPLIRVGVYL